MFSPVDKKWTCLKQVSLSKTKPDNKYQCVDFIAHI